MSLPPQIPLGEILTLAVDEVSLQPDDNYRLAGIYSFGKGLFERDAISGAETSYAKLARLHKDQFVVSKLNGWEGAVDVVSGALDGCHVSGEYPTFAIDSQRADPSYLRWIARWPTFWDRLVPRGSMVRRKRVQTSQLLEVRIPLPPMDEQRRISARLDYIRSEADRATLLASRSNTLADAFGTACASRPDISDEEKLQSGWRRTRLDNVMTRSQDAVHVDLSGSYPNLGMYSFGRGLFAKPPIEGANTSAKTLYRVSKGQFIYSRLFAFEGAYGFVPDAYDGFYVSNEFPSFDVDPARMDARWLASYLRTRERWTELATASTGLGVRRQRVPVEALLSYEVWLPPIDQQRDMVRAIGRLSEVRRARAANSERIDSLVPAALNQEFATLT